MMREGGAEDGEEGEREGKESWEGVVLMVELVGEQGGAGRQKGWKEFRDRVGRGEIELGDVILPTRLSATHVDEASFRSRLNIKETISKLIRELEVVRNVPARFALFSARDRVSWVGNRFNISNFRGDRQVGKDEVGAANGEVDMRVRASPLVQGTNGTLVVRVDQ